MKANKAPASRPATTVTPQPKQPNRPKAATRPEAKPASKPSPSSKSNASPKSPPSTKAAATKPDVKSGAIKKPAAGNSSKPVLGVKPKIPVKSGQPIIGGKSAAPAAPTQKAVSMTGTPATPKAASVVVNPVVKTKEPAPAKTKSGAASTPVPSVKPKQSKKGPWFEESTKTPRQARFRMPAEWESHYGTFLTWPNKKGISFPGKGAYEAAMPAFESMLHALIASEQVFINVGSDEDKQAVRDLLTIAEQSRIHFVDTPAMEPWCRDHGTTFVVRAEDRGGGSIVWKFNAWGQKYDKAKADAAISRRMAEYLGGKIFTPGLVMEGGAIEVNGTGTVLTTESCLLNKNRNRGVKKDDMERLLKDFLGVTNILWLPGGLEGDDTDGHIDTIARFINRTTVVTCVEENHKDKNHAVLAKNFELLKGMKLEDGADLQVVALPMPQPIVRKGQRLPATYANFYIGNKIVLLPTYDDPADEKALEIMVKSFPSRRIYPIDCRELIWGLGAFHCMTQQLPLAAFPKVVDLIRNPPPAPRPIY